MKHRNGDYIFLRVIGLTSLFILLIFVLLLVNLIVFSWPSVKKFGFSFLWNNQWNPVTQEFGARTAILGTLFTSILSIFFAVPLSLGVAFLTDRLSPSKLGLVLSRVLELMAGIPSIVYGIWGLFVLLPLVQKIQLKLLKFFFLFEDTIIFSEKRTFFSCLKPIISFFLKSIPTGSSIFAASLILAIMIVPLISSVIRDVLGSVPEMIKEAALGMGVTNWEMSRKIIIPYAAPGIFGAIILGFGRALGETMAVTFVIGNVHALKGLFMPGITISTSIANEFNEALGDIYPSALVETGLILFLVTFITLIAARSILKRYY